MNPLDDMRERARALDLHGLVLHFDEVAEAD